MKIDYYIHDLKDGFVTQAYFIGNIIYKIQEFNGKVTKTIEKGKPSGDTKKLKPSKEFLREIISDLLSGDAKIW